MHRNKLHRQICRMLLPLCLAGWLMPATAASNPIIRDKFTADPAPLVVGDTLYLYVGHDEAQRDEMFNMREWLVYSTTDMQTWTPHAPIMNVKDFKWAKQDAWAAQAIQKNGKFYFYAAVEHDDTHPGKAIAVAVADRPTGPFVDARGSALITNQMTPKGTHSWEDIDPTVFTDDDGVSWIAWGNRQCYLAKLAPNMIELDGPIREITPPHFEEGPWLHKRGDLYYLTYASLDRSTQRDEHISYSTAPSITGPWTYRGELTGAGKYSFTIHPGIAEFKNQWYLFLHNATLAIGDLNGAIGRRAVTVEHLQYNADGSMRHVTQTEAGVTAAVAASPVPARFERFSYAGKSQEQVRPAAGQYQNPVLSGYYPDPSVTRVGDDYYLVNSTFSHFPGLPVFHSKDLVNWTQIGNAIDRPGQLNFDGLEISAGVFAPDISYHDGTFYIVNTCVGCKGNFVITASNPAGPWSDPVWFDFEGIDPSIFWNDDGKAYIVNNGAPNETPRYDGHRAIWVQEFDYRAMKLVGPRTQLINGGVDISSKPIWIEGPHLFKKDGYYYLSAAEGGTGDGHSQVVFRSQSVFGPFVAGPHNPILSQRTLDPTRKNPVTSAGHAKLVQTQNGDWWATFLATRPYQQGYYNIGRETFLLPVSWQDGWPVILPSGQAIPFAANKPALPAQPRSPRPVNGDLSYVDEFDGAKLSMEWLGLRTPHQTIYTLKQGALELHSGTALGDQGGVPAFVGRRQQHHVATVSTTLTFTPQQAADRAGLVAVQNDKAYLFFGLASIDGKAVVALITRENTGTEKVVASAPVGAGAVTLTIRANGGAMSFDYQAGDSAALRLRSDYDVRFLSTHAAGGFVGTLIGPYSYQPR